LAAFVAQLDESWRGLSLTMPLKVECLRVADRVTRVAEQAGAANTLVRLSDGGWLADNTDVGGFVDSLVPAFEVGTASDKLDVYAWAGLSRLPEKVAILGAGATSRSALLGLAQLGATQVTLYARDLGKAGAFARWAADFGVKVSPAPLSDWLAGDAAVIVSTLPAGVNIPLPTAHSRIELLLDVVYADWPTPLARAAAQSGAKVIGGLELLVNQATRQFEQFTGTPAPVAAMRRAGLQALEEARVG
jgi:shikimate dehydrogenase